MKKRILSIILLASMLISLASCQNSGQTEDHDGQTTEPAETTEQLPAGIEKKNYEKDFTILYPNWSLYQYYYFAEENNGEAMDVALFNRELKVEEYLGLEIKFEAVKDIYSVYPAVQQMAMTGDNLYQIVLTHCIRDTAVMITDGLLLDLNTVNTIDFDHDWWNNVSNENLEVAGHQFFAISDFIIPDPNCIVFNKGMIAALKLENPYELVESGKWTIDKMMEMMAVATLDNGDGEWDINDTYGLATCDDWLLDSLTYSCGEQIANKDENGNFTLALNSRRAYDVFDKLQEFLNSPDIFYYPVEKGFAEYGQYDPTAFIDISSNRCLFDITALRFLNIHTNTTVDFGILPFPKYDEVQDRYISLDWSGLMCAPLIAEDHDMIGEVMELFAYYSSEEVLPTYYDIVLGVKLSRDPESREMLDIIFDGIIFDAGMNYFGFSSSMGAFRTIPHEIAKGNITSYATFLAANEEAAIAELEAFNEAVAALED